MFLFPPYLHPTTFVNVGTMKNSGFEFELHVSAVRMKDFEYSIDFAGATIDNKFANFSNSEYVGQDIMIWLKLPTLIRSIHCNVFLRENVSVTFICGNMPVLTKTETL